MEESQKSKLKSKEILPILIASLLTFAIRLLTFFFFASTATLVTLNRKRATVPLVSVAVRTR